MTPCPCSGIWKARSNQAPLSVVVAQVAAQQRAPRRSRHAAKRPLGCKPQITPLTGRITAPVRWRAAQLGAALNRLRSRPDNRIAPKGMAHLLLQQRDQTSPSAARATVPCHATQPAGR